MEETKVCNKCRKEKPLSMFGRNKNYKDGLQLSCKKCRSEYDKKWREKNPDKMKNYIAKWEIKRYAYRLQTTYGISLADYDEMLVAQGGGCAICGVTSETDGKRLSVDHDHETGKVRGLLCNRCNRCIGSFHDNQHLLRSAANYVERFK